MNISSESAVKLLSEFLDADGPYMPGARHVNAKHFVHEICSYLRSPYRDLKTYDQTVQYDTLPEEDTAGTLSPRRLVGHLLVIVPRGMIETMRTGNRLNRRQSHKRSPSRVPLGQEDPFYGMHSPLSGTRDVLCDVHEQSHEMTVPTLSSSSAAFERQSYRVPGGPNRKGAMTDHTNQIVPATSSSEKTNVPLGNDVAAASEASLTGIMNSILTDDLVNYVDNDLGDSSNAMSSCKGSAGLDVHPRRRTLSAGVQAHLGRLVVSRRPINQRGAAGTGAHRAVTTDGHPTLLSRLTDGPTTLGVCKDGGAGNNASHLTNSPIIAEH